MRTPSRIHTALSSYIYFKGTYVEALNEEKEIVKHGIDTDDVTTMKVH